MRNISNFGFFSWIWLHTCCDRFDSALSIPEQSRSPLRTSLAPPDSASWRGWPKLAWCSSSLRRPGKSRRRCWRAGPRRRTKFCQSFAWKSTRMKMGCPVSIASFTFCHFGPKKPTFKRFKHYFHLMNHKNLLFRGPISGRFCSGFYYIKTCSLTVTLMNRQRLSL